MKTIYPGDAGERNSMKFFTSPVDSRWVRAVVGMVLVSFVFGAEVPATAAPPQPSKKAVAPYAVAVWSTSTGKQLETATADDVSKAWFDVDGRVGIAGAGVEGISKVHPLHHTPERADDDQWRSRNGWVEGNALTGLTRYRVVDERFKRVHQAADSNAFQAIAFVPTVEGPRLVVLANTTLDVFDGTDGQRLRRVKVPSASSCDDFVVGVQRWGERVVVVCDDRAYAFDPLRPKATVVHKNVRNLAAASDGRTLVVLQGKKLHVMDNKGRRRRRPIRVKMKLDDDDSTDLAASPDGRHVALSGPKGQVEVYDVRRGRRIWTWPAPAEEGWTKVAFDTRGRLLMMPETGEVDLLRVDFSRRRPRVTTFPFSHGSWPIIDSYSDGTLLAEISDHHFCRWGADGCSQSIKLHTNDRVRSVALSPDGAAIAVLTSFSTSPSSSSDSSRLAFIRLDPASPLKQQEKATNELHVAIGDRLALLSGKVTHFDAAGRWVVADIDHGAGGVLLQDGQPHPIADFGRDAILLGDRLVSILDTSHIFGHDTLGAWDLKASEPLTLEAPVEGVECLARSEDGTRFATGGNARVIVWDARTLKPLWATTVGRTVNRLRFSKDGERLLAVLSSVRAPSPSEGPTPDDDSLKLEKVDIDGTPAWRLPTANIKDVAVAGETLFMGLERTLVSLSVDGELRPIRRFAQPVASIAVDDRWLYVLTENTRALSVVDRRTGALRRRALPNGALLRMHDADLFLASKGRVVAVTRNAVVLWPAQGPARLLPVGDVTAGHEAELLGADLVDGDTVLVLFRTPRGLRAQRLPLSGPPPAPVELDHNAGETASIVGLRGGGWATSQLMGWVAYDAAGKKTTERALPSTDVVLAKGTPLLVSDGAVVMWLDSKLRQTHQAPLGVGDMIASVVDMEMWGDSAAVLWRTEDEDVFHLSLVQPAASP